MVKIHWKELLDSYLSLHRVVILYGNIHDRFPTTNEGNPETIREILEGKNLASLQRIQRFQFSQDAPQKLMQKCEAEDKGEHQPVCRVFTNMSLLFSETREEWGPETWQKHEQLLQCIEHAHPEDRFIIIFPDEGRIPGNFLANYPSTRHLYIAMPEYIERMNWIEQNQEVLFPTDVAEELREEQSRQLAAALDGLHWSEMTSILQAQQQHQSDIFLLVKEFKFGRQKDHWADIADAFSRSNNAISGQAARIRDEIFGQDEAIEKSLRVVAKACFGLGKIVTPAYSRPKGVMFFVGPTGVGKTMLAKRLAKMIFGDESACHVFDMSEYSQAHAEARLVGAPPGYVGYDKGGQLTGLVHQNPFSVLVFDEIDKADPSILTKFLQILDEGRLTDGKGQTCYFSETLIIFTSNIGALDLQEDDSARNAPYQQLQAYYRDALKRSPSFANHPEILNRVGLSNIVPFRHLSMEEHVARNIEHLWEKTTEHFSEVLGKDLIDDSDGDALVKLLARKANFSTFGMRTVNQTFESEVLEELAWHLLSQGNDSEITIRALPEQEAVTTNRGDSNNQN